MRLFNILPVGIRRSIKGQLADTMERIISRGLQPEQRFFLEERHLQNCTFIRNREEMLHCMPSNAVVAEIGVLHGDFASEILQRSHPEKLFLIDSWEREFSRLKNEVAQRFKTEIGAGVVEIVQSNSIKALNSFPDHFFDWVYLDSDHSYPYTLEELKVLDRKIKPSGIICGDDYTMGVWYIWNSFGVIQSVNEFCISHDYELVYFALAPGMFNSFAIRKIKN
ncbi:class I SAM-dependent methyltransferase [Chitinophaga varians]|uniref:class I SAM-dependent methyltransferase n=1 Tax=Chitinophaga varians TaxID=2202339 RepID=UPI00165ECACD|nr:class I SAM-dependent methyltransferase [Chitinophaga varians]MBC9914698.1 class I SAM-dependent methyltransferase [Chitinophaga varians]